MEMGNIMSTRKNMITRISYELLNEEKPEVIEEAKSETPQKEHSPVEIATGDPYERGVESESSIANEYDFLASSGPAN